MALKISTATVLSGAILAASCTAAPYTQAPSASAQQELARALAGRTQGQPRRCLANFQSRNMQVIDDNTILFHQGKTVYVQRPRNGCPGIGSRAQTLVTRQLTGMQICDGDFAYTVDLRTGVRGGACVFGPFVPYSRR